MKKEWLDKFARNSSTSKECFSIILSNLIDPLCQLEQVAKAITHVAYSKHFILCCK
jgi:hypothetical protein